MSENQNEVYYTLTGRWLSDTVWAARGRWYNTGTPVSVQFDAQKVIDRHIKKKDIMGFYHTHPNMLAYPSFIDYATMNAWVRCLGKPLFCLIEGTDGLQSYYWISDEGVFLTTRSVKFSNYFMGDLS